MGFKRTDKPLISSYLWKLKYESRSTNPSDPNDNHGTLHRSRERSIPMKINIPVLEGIAPSRIPMLSEFGPRANRQVLKFRNLYQDLSKSVRNFNHLKHRQEVLYRMSQLVPAFMERMQKMARLIPAGGPKATKRRLRGRGLKHSTRKRGAPCQPSPLRNVMSMEDVLEMEKILDRDVDEGYHDNEVDKSKEAKNVDTATRKSPVMDIKFVLS